MTATTTNTTAMTITEVEVEVEEARDKERKNVPIECAAVAQYNVRPNTMPSGVELDMEKKNAASVNNNSIVCGII